MIVLESLCCDKETLYTLTIKIVLIKPLEIIWSIFIPLNFRIDLFVFRYKDFLEQTKNPLDWLRDYN